MCLLATSEFSHEAVKKHQETVVNSLKVRRILNFTLPYLYSTLVYINMDVAAVD